jgi:GTP-binding protein
MNSGKEKDLFKIQSAIYVSSQVNWQKLPHPEKPEFAFVGRSNVGKSSLINMLVQRNKLAMISARPGKTQTINHFLVNDEWYLVDLPGYGYAKVSKDRRSKWIDFVRDYLQFRTNLMTTFLLVDASIPPQKTDLEFAEWMGKNAIPFAIVFTKTDKENSRVVSKNISGFKIKMLELWEELPPFFITSATKGSGRDNVLEYIEKVKKSFFL